VEAGRTATHCTLAVAAGGRKVPTNHKSLVRTSAPCVAGSPRRNAVDLRSRSGGCEAGGAAGKPAGVGLTSPRVVEAPAASFPFSLVAACLAACTKKVGTVAPAPAWVCFCLVFAGKNLA